MMFFWIFAIAPTFIVLPNLNLHLHDICFVDILDSFIPIISKTFCFVWNTYYTGCIVKSITTCITSVGLVVHGWLFKDTHFVYLEAFTMLVIDSLKLNDPINTCLIYLHITSYYSQPLNTCER